MKRKNQSVKMSSEAFSQVDVGVSPSDITGWESDKDPKKMSELSMAELKDARCYVCDSCGKQFWPSTASHVCSDGLTVWHTIHRGIQWIASVVDEGDPDDMVVTRPDSCYGSYHQAEIPSNGEVCARHHDYEWETVTRERAQKAGRVPCTICSCDAPGRDFLQMMAEKWEENNPVVVNDSVQSGY